MINADAALKVVFGGKASVNMFDMTSFRQAPSSHGSNSDRHAIGTPSAR
jgi:hypothetical protein